MVTEAQLIGRFRPKQAQDLLKRGLKVQARARVLLGGAAGHPRRIDTGALRSDIGVQLRTVGGSPSVRIGTNKKYARWVHDGTGIYGPRRRRITPTTKKALAFRGRNGRRVVVRSVRGMEKNEFLSDALSAAKS